MSADMAMQQGFDVQHKTCVLSNFMAGHFPFVHIVVKFLYPTQETKTEGKGGATDPGSVARHVRHPETVSSDSSSSDEERAKSGRGHHLSSSVETYVSRERGQSLRPH